MADDARLQIVLEAKIDKLIDNLNKAEQKLGSFSRAGYGAAQKMRDALDRPMGANLGKSLDKLFDSTRLATLEAGASRIRIFGSALEPLGAYGIGAAAGIAAFGVALEQARKATEFADSIERAAKAAHVTTDALQEYRFALGEAGGQEAAADEALQGFSITLGKAKEGLGKAAQAFHALGFTPADVKGFHDTGAALDAVIERIAQLKDTSQKDAIIEQFGLRGLAPLINAGVDRISALKAEALSAGVVMDANLIERGASANREFEKLSKVIDIQLKSAFIDLAPVLTGLVSLAAKMAGYLADAADSIRSVQNRSDKGVQAVIDDLRTRQLKYLQEPGAEQEAIAGSTERGRAITAMGVRIGRLEAMLAARETARSADAQPPGTRNLIPKPGATHAVHDNTSSLTETAARDLDEATKGLANARKALTDNAEAQAAFEIEANNAEAAAAQAKLTHDRTQLLADKTIDSATSDRLQAEIELAQTTTEAARQAREDLITRTKTRKIEDQALEGYRIRTDAQLAELEAQAAITGSLTKREALERRVLELRQQEARDLERAALARRVESHEITQTQADRRLNAFDVTQAAERTQFDAQHADPLTTRLNAIPQSAADMKRSLEETAVHGVGTLSDALLGLANHTETVASAFRKMATSILEDILKLVIQMSIEAPILRALRSAFGLPGAGGGGSGITLTPGSGSISIGDLIPGNNADGTDNWRGGLTSVGERGREYVNLPRGSQVIPNHVIRGIGSAGAISRGPGPISLSVNVDAGGAITEESIRSMVSAGVSHGMRQAIAISTQASRAGAFAANRQDQLLKG